MRSGRQFKKCIVHFRIGQFPLRKQKNKYEIQLCLLKDSDTILNLGGVSFLNKLCFLHGLLTFCREGKHMSDLIKSWRGRAPHQRGAGVFCQLKGLPPNIRQLKFMFRNKGNRTLVGFPWEDKRETHWFKQSAPRIRVENETDNSQSSTLTSSKERLSQGQSSQQAGLLKRGGKWPSPSQLQSWACFNTLLICKLDP